MTDINDIPNRYDTGERIARYIAEHRYIWPGGYEMVAVCDDGGLLCADCCELEIDNIADADHSNQYNGWHVVYWTSTEESDQRETCDHCGRVIHDPE